MKSKKVFLVTIHTQGGRVRTNPLLPNEFHLIKTILNDADTQKVEVEMKTVSFRTEAEFENKLTLMF